MASLLPGMRLGYQDGMRIRSGETEEESGNTVWAGRGDHGECLNHQPRDRSVARL